MIRKARVAGQFYPGGREDLLGAVESFLFTPGERVNAKGVLSPHAGYVYSGGIAGSLYSTVNFPETIAVIGPNHTGHGKRIGISDEDFETPLGIVSHSRNVVGALSRVFGTDNVSHVFEHSIEVQLPFLQVVGGKFELIAITMMDQSLHSSLTLGETLNEVMPENGMVIASSDMSHYVPRAEAERKDKLAIGAIEKIDPELLHRTIEDNDITMCGYGCATAMLHFSRLRGAHEGKLLRYGTSGDVSPMRDVVGYASMLVY